MLLALFKIYPRVFHHIPSYSYYIPILSPLYRHFGWFCTPTFGPFLVSCRVRPRKNAIAEGESVGSAASCKLGRWVTCLVHPRNSRADSGGELSHLFTVFTMVWNVSAITSILYRIIHSYICPPSCHQTLVSWKSTIDHFQRTKPPKEDLPLPCWIECSFSPVWWCQYPWGHGKHRLKNWGIAV